MDSGFLLGFLGVGLRINSSVFSLRFKVWGLELRDFRDARVPSSRLTR